MTTPRHRSTPPSAYLTSTQCALKLCGFFFTFHLPSPAPCSFFTTQIISIFFPFVTSFIALSVCFTIKKKLFVFVMALCIMIFFYFSLLNISQSGYCKCRDTVTSRVLKNFLKYVKVRVKFKVISDKLSDF